MKFTKDGKFIKTWGRKGSGPGEFDIPHALAIDSRGRLFVGDRNNNRIQIFDQDGKLPRPVDPVQPAERHLHRQATTSSMSPIPNRSRSPSSHDGWKRGIRIGSANDGEVTAFIPDPVEKTTGTSAAEGVAADAAGNIYGAEVGPKRLMKYVRK